MLAQSAEAMMRRDGVGVTASKVAGVNPSHLEFGMNTFRSGPTKALGFFQT
jgi:hypothetical protein